MSLIKRYITAMIMLQLAFAVVNATGIFPYKSSITGFNHTLIQSEFNDVKTGFENAAGGLEYLAAAGYLLITGVRVIISFVLAVFFGFPDVLRAFMIPDSLAIPVGFAVDSLMLLGIGYLMIKRA